MTGRNTWGDRLIMDYGAKLREQCAADVKCIRAVSMYQAPTP